MDKKPASANASATQNPSNTASGFPLRGDKLEKAEKTEKVDTAKPRKTHADTRSKSPLKTEPVNAPKRNTTFGLPTEQNLKRVSYIPVNLDGKNTKRLKFVFKKHGDVMANIAKIQQRRYNRQPLSVYLEYLNNKEIETITHEHIYIFELYRIAKQFDDEELVVQIVDYINQNITLETVPLFVLEIVNLIEGFDKTFDEIFEDLNNEYRGALGRIISFFSTKNVKEIVECIKTELELFLMETENLTMRKVDFLMYFMNKIPSVNEKCKVVFVSVFLRHFGRLNNDFNLIVDKYLGKDFLIRNKDLVKDVYAENQDRAGTDPRNAFTDGESVIYRNLFNKAELKYKLKLSQMEELVKNQFSELAKKLDEYKQQNEELVQKNHANEKEIVSLKHNVVNLTKNQMRSLVKEDSKDSSVKNTPGAEITGGDFSKNELEALRNEVRSNGERITELEKEKIELKESNEKLIKKSKKHKKNVENIKITVEEIEKMVLKYKADQDYTNKELSKMSNWAANSDDLFGSITKDLDIIKLYLQKEYSEHENIKKSNNILRLLNSQMEEKIKTVEGSPPVNLGKGGAQGRPTVGSSATNKVIATKQVQSKPRNRTLNFSMKKSYPPAPQQINCLINISYGTTDVVATGGTDNVIKLYNLESWDQKDVIVRLTGHRDYISSLLFVNELQPILISGSGDRTIKIWKLSNNSCIQNIIAHAQSVISLLYLGRNMLVSGSGDKTTKIWNINNGACVKNISIHNDFVSSLVSLSSLKKTVIASGSWDSTVKIWDYEDTDDSVSTLEGHEGYVNCLLYIENWDRELLVSASKDKTIKLWNVIRGDLVRTSKGHEGSVTSLLSLTSVESSLIISGSEDRTLRVWYMTTGDCVSVVKSEHSFGVKIILRVELKKKEKPDEKECFLTVGNDNIVKLWQLD